MPAGLDEPLCALDAEVRDPDVVLDLLVVGRGPDLRGDAAPEVGDLLGALVDQEDHHVALGIVLEDSERHVAQENRLPGPGRRDDQAARALPDGAEQVDGARRHPAVLHLELEVLVRGHRGERGEVEPAAPLLERHPVDGLDVAHLGIREPALGRERGPADEGSGLELEAPDQLLRDKRVRRAPLAVLHHVEELAVAPLGHVDVEDPLDMDRVVKGRGGSRRGGRSSGGGCGVLLGRGGLFRRGGKGFLFHTK